MHNIVYRNSARGLLFNLQSIPSLSPCRHLSHHHTFQATHITFLSGDLEVAINNSDGHKDTGAAAQSTHQVASNRQSTDASTPEGRGRGDDALEFLVHRFLAVASHDESLFLELFGDVTGGGARNLDPGLGEDGAGDEHVDNKDGGLKGIGEGLGDAERRRPEKTILLVQSMVWVGVY